MDFGFLLTLINHVTRDGFNLQPCFYKRQHFHLKKTSLQVSAHSHVFITDDRNLKQPQQERQERKQNMNKQCL